MGKWKTLSAVDQHQQDTTASSAEEISASGGKRDMEVEVTNIQEKMKALLANLESLQKDQMTQTDERSTSTTDQIVHTEETLSFNVRVR